MRRGALALTGWLLAVPTQAVDKADLNGTWILLEADNPDPEELLLTEAGQEMYDDYDPLSPEHDLDLACIPISFTNLMHTPSPPIEIRVLNDRVEIDYEYHDVQRVIPLDGDLPLEEAPVTVVDWPRLGRSMGRFEGDVLVVETLDQAPGYLDTGSQGVPGLPKSEEMRTIERFVAEENRLRVDVTHFDPRYYNRPMHMGYDYTRIDTELMEWGCILEGAHYETQRQSSQD